MPYFAHVTQTFCKRVLPSSISVLYTEQQKCPYLLRPWSKKKGEVKFQLIYKQKSVSVEGNLEEWTHSIVLYTL